MKGKPKKGEPRPFWGVPERTPPKLVFFFLKHATKGYPPRKGSLYFLKTKNHNPIYKNWKIFGRFNLALLGLGPRKRRPLWLPCKPTPSVPFGSNITHLVTLLSVHVAPRCTGGGGPKNGIQLECPLVATGPTYPFIISGALSLSFLTLPKKIGKTKKTPLGKVGA